MAGMAIRYDEVLDPLRAAYDGGADWRDGISKERWKLAERQAFLDRLPPGSRLLEIGAGTGQDSLYFQQQGFGVVAADLSAAMVERCRAKGIEAHVMDFLHLDFPAGSFDAVFAMNCLLHVPNHDLPARRRPPRAAALLLLAHRRAAARLRRRRSPRRGGIPPRRHRPRLPVPVADAAPPGPDAVDSLISAKSA
jgi:SAM-dependent methyltransferase